MSNAALGLKHAVHRFIRNERGVAFIEFAYILPVFMIMALGGVEVTQFITTKMRISQLALHVADHAARIGSGSLLAAKTINEQQIDDLFEGSGFQAGELDLYAKGRVILSSLEPVANPNTTDRYKIAWQRCRGQAAASTYGVADDTNMTGMGPAGRQVKAPKDSAVMFVEIIYTYRPIIASRYAPSLRMSEFASMTVRDRRDLTQVYPSAGTTPSNCS